jgi:pullulanase/glycogen debranching enzyme
MTVLGGSCFWWAEKPGESTNFVECHDNDTLMDFTGGDKRKVRLAATLLLCSQGVPMLHEGMEFGKDKKGNSNSYDQDNEINWIDWTLKDRNRSLFNFWKGLIDIRQNYPVLRQRQPLSAETVSWVQPAENKALGMFLKGKDRTLAVLINGNKSSWHTFSLAPGSWKVLSDGTNASSDGLRIAVGDYSVPPVTAVILVSQ